MLAGFGSGWTMPLSGADEASRPVSARRLPKERIIAFVSTTSYLDRLLDPLTDVFTPEMASALLKLRADSELEAHIDALRRKANEGTLTQRRMRNTRISLRPSI